MGSRAVSVTGALGVQVSRSGNRGVAFRGARTEKRNANPTLFRYLSLSALRGCCHTFPPALHMSTGCTATRAAADQSQCNNIRASTSSLCDCYSDFVSLSVFSVLHEIVIVRNRKLRYDTRFKLFPLLRPQRSPLCVDMLLSLLLFLKYPNGPQATKRARLIVTRGS